MPRPQRHHQGQRKHRDHRAHTSRGAQNAGADHPQQAQAFAPAHQAAALVLIAAKPRAPGLVGQAQGAQAHTASHQGQAGHTHQAPRRCGHGQSPVRKKQQHQTPAQQHAARARPGQHPRVGLGKPAIGTAPQPGVDEGVAQARGQQQSADPRQGQGVGVGIVVGQHHVQGQGHKGQRETHRAQTRQVGALKRPKRGRHGLARPSKRWRSSG